MVRSPHCFDFEFKQDLMLDMRQAEDFLLRERRHGVSSDTPYDER
jgi:hypothetical protein